MSGLPLKRLYIGMVGVAGLIAFIAWAPAIAFWDLPRLALIGPLVTLAEVWRVALPSGEGISAGAVLILMALFTWGPGAAIAVLAAGLLGSTLIRRVPVTWWVFNAGQLAVATGVAGAVALAVGRVPPGRDPAGLVGAALAVASYFAVSLSLVTGLMYLDAGLPYGRTWLRSAARLAPQAAVWGALGVVLAWSHPWGWGQVALAAGLVGLEYLLLRYHGRLLADRAVSQLLKQVARVDPQWRAQAERAARLATTVGRSLGLGPGDLLALRYATLLHDIGLWGRGSSLLEKRLPLGPEEHEVVRRHPVAGAEIVGQFQALVEVARLIRHHGEWFNGLGYPDGLKGEEIPPGSRIIAVVTAYDAMTAGRPYRSPMAPSHALAEIQRLRGVQFCPRVVDALAATLAEQQLRTGEPLIVPPAAVGPTAAGGQPDRPASDLNRLAEELSGLLKRSPLRVPDWLASPLPWTARGWARACGAAHLDTLSAAGRVLNASLGLDRLLESFCRLVGEVFRAQCLIYLVDETGTRLVCRAASGLRQPPAGLATLSVMEDLAGRALLEQRVQFSYRVAADPRVATAERLARAGVFSVLYVPLNGMGHASGVLAVASDRPRRFSAQEVALLRVLAGHAGLAIDHAGLHEETSRRLAEVSSIKGFVDQVVTHVPVGMVVVDAAGVIRLTNRAFVDLLRSGSLASGGSVVGCRLEEQPWAQAPPFDLIARSVASGLPYQAETRVGRGAPLVVRLQTVVLPGLWGDAPGVIAVAHDLTEARRLEEQARQSEKLAALGELAARAAHEIRNPLAAIRGFTQLLQARLPTGDNARYLGIIVREIDRIDQLLRELLGLARPPGSLFQQLDLTTVVEESCLLVAAEAGRCGVRLERNYALPSPWVRGSPEQLKQVVLNLLTNAVQAMPGGGTVRVEVEPGPGTGWVSIRVRDEGTGIAPQDRARLFEPFFSTKPGGTGLGLAVSQGIVRGHGGWIEVESEPGRGSSFTVVLPAGQPAAGAGPLRPAGDAALPRPGHGR